MKEFWESAFNRKQEMWGMKPTKSAELTSNFFLANNLQDILIPGIGYGRNAQAFIENGIKVTGIEISKRAIELAKKHYGSEMDIFHGTVNQMPFENKKYDGIFCHALIHLLDNKERKRLLQNCYNQLSENGFRVFTAISKNASQYGQGELISKDRYEIHKGAKIYYYDQESVKTEFEDYGLFEITEVDENQPMYLIKCKKE